MSPAIEEKLHDRGLISKRERTVLTKDRQGASFKLEKLRMHLLRCLRKESIPEHAMMTKQRVDVLERVDRAGRPGAFLISRQGIPNLAEPVRLNLLDGIDVQHEAIGC
jgi:hypothetical protein